MPHHGSLLVETVTNGPFVENCYIIADAQGREAIVVDPGDEEQRIVERVHALDVKPKEIVCTHAHIDHVGAVAGLKRLWGVPFALHPAERSLLEHLPTQSAAFGLPPKEVPQVDRELVDGEAFSVGQLRCQVRVTPGHSPGGCCLYFEEQAVVLVGDTLFAGSIGRSDLPGGDMDTLLDSIRQTLLPLDDSTVVYSGHGPATTIGVERQANPFLID